MTMNDELDLTISRFINAPRSAVWKAWVEPEYLKQWWCPKPWRTEVHGFDFRPGGAFDTLMLGPDGETSQNPGSFLEIVPQERIVFTSALTEGWRPAPSPFILMTAIITMEDENEGTRYTARVLHKDSSECKQHDEMGFQEGWGICIEQLEDVAQQLILEEAVS